MTGDSSAQSPRQSPAGGSPRPGDPDQREAARPDGDASPRTRRSEQGEAHVSRIRITRPQPRRPLSAGRRTTTPELLALARRLQPRDQVIANLLVEHRTLTTSQLAVVLFPSHSAARARLYRLRQLGWVESFTPIRAAGPLETHWVAGLLAARYVAVHQDTPPPTAHGWRDRLESVAASSHLEHGDGANQVFVDLLAHARAHPGTRLTRWWGSARTAAALGQRVHPDGHGVWVDGDRQVGFLLEFDTGTEVLSRLVAKIEPYARLRRDGGPDYPVLFVLPNATRETNLHRKLNGHASRLGVTVATTTPVSVARSSDGLVGAVWKIAGNGRPRHPLADLPHRPGEPGPYHPGPPTPDQDPLHLLRTTSLSPDQEAASHGEGADSETIPDGLYGEPTDPTSPGR
jgi:hypothetical protein